MKNMMRSAFLGMLSLAAFVSRSWALSATSSQTLDAAIAGTKPHDLSVWTMFLNADIVVKVVMAGLLLASIGTWTVFVAKTIELKRARKRAIEAIARLSEARGLSEARLALGHGDRLTTVLLSEATRELRLSSDILAGPGVKERVASCFAEVERAEALSIKRGTGLLASVGSTGPFVGLFGTVWGIMNSFIGISKAQTTNLAVVAPGIAEALLATAIGLFAAIPAVLIYNHLARQTGAYLELVSNVSGELLRIVSRDLDRGHHASKIQAAE
ncbi:Biopolymer transport protein ExbB [freshwater sediment metagenome]|uniref:Biopolymer transport protein ExbB n=1 Tax=freshwater sediment metagenome TaxID=556182 RepID=A0AA48R9F5_9ZZZZ